MNLRNLTLAAVAFTGLIVPAFASSEAEIAKVEQKLANPNFTSKVPPQVLVEHQQRLVEWQAKLEHVRNALVALEG